MISICLVDDQNLVRQGVRSLLDLAEDIRVVAECADGAQALVEVPRIKPDVMLLDLRMPNMSGLEVLGWALKNLTPCPPVLLNSLAVSVSSSPRIVTCSAGKLKRYSP